jgi:Transposase and inactivated derivatives, IS30 family
MPQYIIRRAPRQHFDFEFRKFLAVRWNARVKSLDATLSVRDFARSMGISKSAWARELRRGATGRLVRNVRVRQGNRWCYPTYDPVKAQLAAKEHQAQKGPPMKMTNLVAREFARLVKEERRSPYDARMTILETHPAWHVPSLRTFYNHIEAGDIGVPYGATPYHPGEKRSPRTPPHPAKTAPGRRRMPERPPEADARSETGHFEMDTIVSGVGGRGGLLVLTDRRSRLAILEELAHINQASVLQAIRRILRRRNSPLQGARSVTTDNGCEFLGSASLEKILGCNVYYTQAYAAWEKGSVENLNRLVRRWHPKGTDFSKVPARRIRNLEAWLNSIHRESLGGQAAIACQTSVA